MHSHHSSRRCQQRSIPTDAVDAILAYGASHRRKGADVYYLDRAARSRIAEAIGAERYRKLERALDAYLVMSDDGVLITAAHRYRRLKF